MKARILLVSLFLSLLIACDKKEDDIKPGQDYSGTLTLDYSRSFPTFTTTLSVPVEISSSGQAVIAQPVPLEFQGESDKMIRGERIKIREEGVITISDIAPVWKNQDGQKYLEVSLSLVLEGNQTVWRWNNYYWEQTADESYAIQDPVECPMTFRIDNALLSESVCAARCEDCWGHNNFKWRLRLHEAP